jgi:hypothetical protein
MPKPHSAVPCVPRESAWIQAEGEAETFDGGEMVVMEPIDIFKKIRDASDEVLKALASNDEKALEDATDKFMLLMIKLNCQK